MLVGYARVSTNHQNLERQLAVLRAAGCKCIFKEKESGREGVKRPELERAIETLGAWGTIWPQTAISASTRTRGRSYGS